MEELRKYLIFAIVVLTGMTFALTAFAADYHIGIMTPTVSQAEDDYRGAEAVVKKYGDVDKGGIIRHITCPDQFSTEIETTITQLVGLADDPKMKAIIVVEAVPGVTEAFRRIKEMRPDILRVVASPHEDPAMVASVSDVVVDIDRINWGWRIMAAVKKMGADTFVHISFPRHMSMELLARRAAVFREAAKQMGLKFYLETAPDPLSEVGVAGTQQFLLEKVPAWIEKYGQKTAFITTNSAHHEPLIKRIVSHGGIYAYGDGPSPIRGFPGALNVDLSQEKGDWPAMLAKVEKAAVEAGASGRLGTWRVSLMYTEAPALTDHVIRVLEGKAKIADTDAILETYKEHTKVEMFGDPYVDAATGMKVKNMILLSQEPYVFGVGPLDMSDVVIPDNINEIR